MKRLSKIRIKRILENHCFTVDALFSRAETDEFGDITEEKGYANHRLYISQLLHRYNPYTGLRTTDEAVTHRRRVPMAILPYDKPLDIKIGDTVTIENKKYSVSFVEDMKGYYYLLSIIPKE
ncbi:MAG: hypothetical protein IKB50_01690 [Clostridia bacterium]|nr:hypothetical protein [Clostridia bacterium]